MKEMCLTCRYYDEVDQKNTLFGQCRRNPPKIVDSKVEKTHKTDNAYEAIYYATAFPIVRMNSMCGEWKEKG